MTPPSLIGVGALGKQEDKIYAVEVHTTLAPNAHPIPFGLIPQNGIVVIPLDKRVVNPFDERLLFLAGDFPHVHRRIEVHGCDWPNCEPRVGPRQDPATLFLRRGESSFRYRRPNVLLPLNVHAVMRTLLGHTLSSVSIE
jgi:hypothetical protein